MTRTRKAWEDYIYRYTATVLEVRDGDTLRVDFDYGFGMIDSGKLFRLYGVGAPELKEPGGVAARTALKKLCPPGSVILVQTIYDKMEKYGRFLGIAWGAPGDFTGKGIIRYSLPAGSINAKMVQTGKAAEWYGDGKPPKVS